MAMGHVLLAILAAVVAVQGMPTVMMTDPDRTIQLPGVPTMGGIPVGASGSVLSTIPSYMDGTMAYPIPSTVPEETTFTLTCPGAGESAFAMAGNTECTADPPKFAWTNWVEGDAELPLLLSKGCGNKGKKVGMVQVTFADGKVKLRYEVDEEYHLVKVNLHVGVTPFPSVSGKPSVDVLQFPFSDDTLPVTTEFSFPVQGDGIYISVHAVVSAQSSCCTFFMAVHHCPPCSTSFNGGWDALLQTGWEARSCGPKVRRGQNENPMVVYRTEVPAGSSLTTVPSSKPTAHLAIFSTTECGVEWCQKSKGHRPVTVNPCLQTCPEFIPQQ